MRDTEIFENISKKLDVIIKLLWEAGPGENTSINDGVRILRDKGFSNEEIAFILGTTKGTVGVAVSRLGLSSKKEKKNEI